MPGPLTGNTILLRCVLTLFRDDNGFRFHTVILMPNIKVKKMLTAIIKNQKYNVLDDLVESAGHF